MGELAGQTSQLPHVIAALDTGPDIGPAVELIGLLGRSFSREDLGIKISKAHLVKCGQRMIELVRGHNKFTIVETHLNDTASNNADLVEVLLSSEQVPDAFTIQPFRDGESAQLEVFRKRIIAPAHGVGVKIIGFAEQLWVGRGDEEHVADKAVIRYREAKDMGFDDRDAFEVPFPALRYFFNNPTNPLNVPNNGHPTTSEKTQEDAHDNFMVPKKPPTVVTSTFYKDGVRMSQTEVISAAGEAFKLGAAAVYLGSSLVRSQDPVGMVREVLSIRERKLGLIVGDVSA